MGMYTELFISTQIKDDEQVIKTLKYMIGQDRDLDEDFEFPDHPLFKSERWSFMLTGSSHYFVPAASNFLEYNDISKTWSFINRSDFKNYNNEINLFFDWLDPYIDAQEGEMIGYSRYEESQHPTVQYKGGISLEYRS